MVQKIVPGTLIVCDDLACAEELMEDIDDLLGYPRPGRNAETGEIVNADASIRNGSGNPSGWTMRYAKPQRYADPSDPEDLRESRPSYLTANQVEFMVETFSRNIPTFMGVDNALALDRDFAGNKLVPILTTDIQPATKDRAGVKRHDKPLTRKTVDLNRRDPRDEPDVNYDKEAARDNIYPTRKQRLGR